MHTRRDTSGYVPQVEETDSYSPTIARSVLEDILHQEARKGGREEGRKEEEWKEEEGGEGGEREERRGGGGGGGERKGKYVHAPLQ